MEAERTGADVTDLRHWNWLKVSAMNWYVRRYEELHKDAHDYEAMPSGIELKPHHH
jgi:hypothetical protein